jgi:hypothetical protein
MASVSVAGAAPAIQWTRVDEVLWWQPAPYAAAVKNRDPCDVPGCDRAARYQFGTGPQTCTRRCVWHGVLYWPIVRRAGRVALLVGTVLFVINQSDVVLRGDTTALVVAKIGLTYLVPFSVSTYSALAANRLRVP